MNAINTKIAITSSTVNTQVTQQRNVVRTAIGLRHFAWLKEENEIFVKGKLTQWRILESF